MPRCLVPNAIALGSLGYSADVNSPINTPSPQFGTAEYVGVSGSNYCQYCHQPIGASYFRVHDTMACPGCAEKVAAELARDTHAAYMRAILFGVGAAILGMIIYATFTIVTGLIVGYVSLGVGWMVGTAMKKGSRGVGGRRYQIAAALLTYAAVSMAAVPIWIHNAREQYAKQPQIVEKQRVADNQQTTKDEVNSDDQTATDNADHAGQPGTRESDQPRRTFLAAIGKIALLGIASPFLELWESGPNFGWMIGAFILFIGMQIAWRLTSGTKVAVYGPFENSSHPTS